MTECPYIAGSILPLDLMVSSLSYLSPHDAYLASQVCRWWGQLLRKAPMLEHIQSKNRRDTLCDYTAKHGHLKVLQWARANGCEWNSSTCANAAHGGHLEVLQWARANSCE